MKTFKIDVSKVEDSEFEGYAEIEIPNVKERLEMVKEMNINEVMKGDNVEAGFDLFAKVEERFKSIKVSYTDIDGNVTEFTDIEELTCFNEGFALYQKLSGYVINGLPLGNDLRLR